LAKGLRLYAGSIATAVVVALLLAQLLSFARVGLSTFALLALAAGALAVVLAGEIALRLARIEQIAARPLFALSLGSVVTSIFLVAAVFVTSATAGQAFVIWGLVVFACTAALGKREACEDAFEWADLVTMAAIGTIIAVGCRAAAEAVPTLEATGRLPVWIDAYIHGTVIANFGDPLATGRGNILLAGVPLDFYHYGYYQLPAAVMGLVPANGLEIATAVLLPLGLFLGAIAVYALASEMADRRAGVLALALLVLVPDASHYGLANGFFGFHWLLFTNPGCGYGLAACASGLATLVIWLRTGNVRALILAALSITAVMQLRAHFFLWLAPAAVGTVLLAMPFARRHAGAIWAFGLLGFAGLVFALLTVAPLQRLWLANSVVVDYIFTVHAGQEPTAYTGLYGRLLATLGAPAAALVGTAMIVPAMLGAFVIAYPLMLTLSVRARGWQPIDALPLLLLIVFVVITLFAPATAWGDITEYQHRAFVLAYTVIAVWTSVYVVRLLPPLAASPLWIALGSTGVATGAVALVTFAGIVPGAPRFNWAKDYYDVPVEAGIVAVARDIRLKSKTGDVVAVGPALADVYLVDPATQIASLTDLPTFLARYKSMISENESVREIAQHRLEVQKKVEAATDPGIAADLLKKEGVTWYVWLGKAGPAFDAQHRTADFATQDVAVYRVDALAPRSP
jgi:hypothetical protein